MLRPGDIESIIPRWDSQPRLYPSLSPPCLPDTVIVEDVTEKEKEEEETASVALPTTQPQPSPLSSFPPPSSLPGGLPPQMDAGTIRWEEGWVLDDEFRRKVRGEVEKGEVGDFQLD